MNFAMKLKTERQDTLEAIKDIGFSHLLDVDFPAIRGQWAAELLSHFEVDSCAFVLPNMKKIRIKAADVRNIYGIPQGKMKIEDPSNQKEQDRFDNVLYRWRRYWGITEGTPSLTEMMEGLMSRALDRDWIRSFVVLAVSCLIKVNRGKYLNFRIMSALSKINNIQIHDWCTYTKEAVVSSVADWHENPNGRFDGPIYLMMVSILLSCRFFWVYVKCVV